MPGYQRFVTYMFRYENGRKQENCGFAKVEVRHQDCRIQIKLKGVLCERLTVYLLDENVEFPTGLRMGDMTVHDGTAEHVFRCTADHIHDSEYGINEMRGIYIVGEDDGFYASQWDDQQTVWDNFQEWNHSMVKKEEGSAEEKAEAEHRGESAGMKPEMEHRAGSAERKAETEHRGESAGMKPEAEHRAGSVEERVGLKNENNKNQIARNTENYDAEENKEVQAMQKSDLTFVQNANHLKCVKGLKHMLSDWEGQWNRFTAAHALFCPFDEDDGVYGVKLQMQDFQVLPKQYHYLANNSFLLHGYYNYQMVLFGYMDVDGKEKRWFLGVPGVFSNQEQLMAGIFGFPEFRTKQVTRQKTGEFGYWYRYLDMRT